MPYKVLANVIDKNIPKEGKHIVYNLGVEWINVHNFS